MTTDTHSPRAVAASQAAIASRDRRPCPQCSGLRSLERVTEPITAPLLPRGHCRIRCSRCQYTQVVETRLWREGRYDA